MGCVMRLDRGTTPLFATFLAHLRLTPAIYPLINES